MQRIDDGELTIIIDGPVGFGNNIYLLIDQATGESAFVDAPGQASELAAVAEAAGARPTKILLTHSHGDHTAAIDGLKEIYGCEVYADAAEPWLKPGQLDHVVAHGGEVTVGRIAFRAMVGHLHRLRSGRRGAGRVPG